MKNIQKKGQHSPVVQLFLKHLVSSNALFFIFPPQTLARVQRSAILRSQSRPREALLARTNYGKKISRPPKALLARTNYGKQNFAYGPIALAAASIPELVRSPGDRVFAARLAGVF